MANATLAAIMAFIVVILPGKTARRISAAHLAQKSLLGGGQFRAAPRLRLAGISAAQHARGRRASKGSHGDVGSAGRSKGEGEARPVLKGKPLFAQAHRPVFLSRWGTNWGIN